MVSLGLHQNFTQFAMALPCLVCALVALLIWMSNLPDPPGDEITFDRRGESDGITPNSVSSRVRDPTPTIASRLSTAPTGLYGRDGSGHWPPGDSARIELPGTQDYVTEPTTAAMALQDRDGLLQPSRSWARALLDAAVGRSVTPPYQGGLSQPPRYRRSEPAAPDAVDVTGTTALETGDTSGQSPSDYTASKVLDRYDARAVSRFIHGSLRGITSEGRTALDYLHVNWYQERGVVTSVSVPPQGSQPRRLAAIPDDRAGNWWSSIWSPLTTITTTVDATSERGEGPDSSENGSADSRTGGTSHHPWMHYTDNVVSLITRWVTFWKGRLYTFWRFIYRVFALFVEPFSDYFERAFEFIWMLAWFIYLVPLLVGILLAYFFVTWIVMPGCLITLYVVSFLSGRSSWGAVRRAFGEPPSKRSPMYGPGTSNPISSHYITTGVKGRTTGQRPFDIIVSHNGKDYSRLRTHGLKGVKVTREGVHLKYDFLVSSTSSKLTSLLEKAKFRIHLCADTPCRCPPGGQVVHVIRSCVVPQDEDFDLQDLVKMSPAFRFFCLGSKCIAELILCTFRKIKYCLQWACSFCCCRHFIQHSTWDDSEPESEEQAEPCQALAIAYLDGSDTVPLTCGTCNLKSDGFPITLLHDDVEISNKPELTRTGRLWTANLCPNHRNKYEVACMRRKCAITDCFLLGAKCGDGIQLCSYHRADRALNQRASSAFEPGQKRDVVDAQSQDEATPSTPSGTKRLNKRVLDLIDQRRIDAGDVKQYKRRKSRSPSGGGRSDSRAPPSRWDVSSPKVRSRSASPAPAQDWLRDQFYTYLAEISDGTSQEDALRAVSTDSYPPTEIGLLFFENLKSLSSGLPPLAPIAQRALTDLQSGQPDWPSEWIEDFPKPSASLKRLADFTPAGPHQAPGPHVAPSGGPSDTRSTEVQPSEATTPTQSLSPAIARPSPSRGHLPLEPAFPTYGASATEASAAPSRGASDVPQALQHARPTTPRPTGLRMPGQASENRPPPPSHGFGQLLGSLPAGLGPASAPQPSTSPLPRMYHVGAYTGITRDADSFTSSNVDLTRRGLLEIVNRIADKDEPVIAARGTLKYLTKQRERVVYLVRGCDHYNVALCPGLLGKDLYRAGRRMQLHDTTALRALHVPVNLTNAILYGITAGEIGGKNFRSMPKYSLSSHHFPHTTEKQLDDYSPGADEAKLEDKPAEITNFTLWVQASYRKHHVLSLFYGEEWRSIWDAGVDSLFHLNHKYPHIYDGPRCRDFHEELWARFWTEVDNLDIAICRYLEQHNPPLADVKFVCTTPMPDGSAWWTPPNPFDLADPNGYFTTTMKPKLGRDYERAMCSIAFKSSSENNRRVGDTTNLCPRCKEPAHKGRCKQPKPDPVTPSPRPAGLSQSAGGGQQAPAGSSPTPADNAVPADAVDPRVGAAPKRPTLTKAENEELRKHLPKAGNEQLCLNFSTHLGCKHGDSCKHKHASIPWDKQHYTVRMYFLSRLGHASKTKLTVKAAEAEIKALRAQHQAQLDGVKAEGKAKAKAKAQTGRKVGFENNGSDPKASDPSGLSGSSSPWSPPEELAGFYKTQKEAELQHLIEGPDYGWLKDVDCADHHLPVPETTSEPLRSGEGEGDRTVDRRLQLMSKVDTELANQSLPDFFQADNHLETFQHRTDPWEQLPLKFAADGAPQGPLGTYLRSALLNKKAEALEQGEAEPCLEGELDGFLATAAVYGLPQLAYPAQQYLHARRGTVEEVVNRKVGSERAYTSPIRSSGPGMPGVGMFRWHVNGVEKVWRRYDYGDSLPMSKPRAAHFNLPPLTIESHKCFFMCLGAALVWLERGHKPSIEEAQIKARALLDAFQKTSDGIPDSLGEPADFMPQAEADLRVIYHDLVHANHDIDYRLPAALPIADLAKLRLCFARVDIQHRASLDTITGPQYNGSPKNNLWFHARAGHLTVLMCDEACDAPPFARDIPALGWQAHLDAAQHSPHMVPLPSCKYCTPPDDPYGYRTGATSRNGYEPGAFGTGEIPSYLVGYIPEASPSTPVFPGTDAEALTVLANASAIALPSAHIPFLHLTFRSTTPPLPAWRIPGAVTLCVSPDTVSQVSLLAPAVRALRHYTIDLLFIEHCASSVKLPSGVLTASAHIQTLFHELVALAELQHTKQSTVLITAPVHSAAWQHKQTTTTLSARHWQRGRAPACLTPEATSPPQRWTWYSNSTDALKQLNAIRSWESFKLLLGGLLPASTQQPDDSGKALASQVGRGGDSSGGGGRASPKFALAPLTASSPHTAENATSYGTSEPKDLYAHTAENTASHGTLEPKDLSEATRFAQQGNIKAAANQLGTFVRVAGISHSGAVQYQIGQQSTGRLVIARQPLPEDDLGNNPRLAEAVQAYWQALEADPSPHAYAQAGFCGDTCLQHCGRNWVRLAAVIRYSWELKRGSHFEGLFDPALDQATPHAGLLQSARRVAQAGVDARISLETGPHKHAEHYGSALAHLPKILSKMWEDAQKGRAVFLTSASEDYLEGVISAPLGFVGKTLLDRTKSLTEGREVVDPKLTNDEGTKELYFPALTPRHSELGRQILWWSVQYPKIPVLIAKKDVSDAFKWLWLLSECAGLFSTEFKRNQAGLDCNLVVIWLVLNFGWLGGPGCFARFGTLLRVIITNFRPAKPEWHTTVPFRPQIWCDDLVIVEPALGVRPWMSLGLAEATLTKALGPAALNVVKDLLEGKLETHKLTWGLNYSTPPLTRGMPRPQLEKASYLLHSRELDWGYIDLQHRLAQVLRGSQEFWISADPSMAPLAGYTNALLGPPSEEGIVQPRGTLRVKARTFLNFWSSTELMRLMIECRDVWEIRFMHSLTKCLTINELLAVPAYSGRVKWTSGDATPEKYAGINWSADGLAPGFQGEVMVASCQEYRGHLRTMMRHSEESLRQVAELLLDRDELLGDSAVGCLSLCGARDGSPRSRTDLLTEAGNTLEDESLFIIAIDEFIVIIALVVRYGPGWTHCVIIYASDNMLVQQWLDSRVANHPLATFFIMLVMALEADFRLRVHVTYIRTYHNTAADDFTRSDTQGMLEKYKLVQVDAPDLAPFLKEGWVRRAFVWDGQSQDDTKTARQLAGNRHAPGPASNPTITCEVGDGLMVYTRMALMLQSQASCYWTAELSHLPTGLARLHTQDLTGIKQIHLLLASNPVTALAIETLKGVLHKVTPTCAAFDFPSLKDAALLTQLLDSLKLTWHVVPASGKLLGDQVRWRKIVIWVGSTLPPQFADSHDHSDAHSRWNLTWCINEKNVPKENWTTFVPLSKPLHALGNLGATPSGYVSHNNKEVPVWSPEGPLPGLHKGSWAALARDPLLLHSSSKTSYRQITAAEAALLLGCQRFELGDSPETAALRALRSTPRSLARHVVTAAYQSLGPPGTKVGVCSLPHEASCDSTWMKFLAEEAGLPTTPYTGAEPPTPVGSWDPTASVDASPGKALLQGTAAPAKWHKFRPPQDVVPLICSVCDKVISQRKAKIAPGCDLLVHQDCFDTHLTSCRLCKCLRDAHGRSAHGATALSVGGGLLQPPPAQTYPQAPKPDGEQPHPPDRESVNQDLAAAVGAAPHTDQARATERLRGAASSHNIGNTHAPVSTRPMRRYRHKTNTQGHYSRSRSRPSTLGRPSSPSHGQSRPAPYQPRVQERGRAARQDNDDPGPAAGRWHNPSRPGGPAHYPRLDQRVPSGIWAYFAVAVLAFLAIVPFIAETPVQVDGTTVSTTPQATTSPSRAPRTSTRPTTITREINKETLASDDGAPHIGESTTLWIITCHTLHLLSRAIALSIQGIAWTCPFPCATSGVFIATVFLLGFAKFRKYREVFDDRCSDWCTTCPGPPFRGKPACQSRCVKPLWHEGPHACCLSCPVGEEYEAQNAITRVAYPNGEQAEEEDPFEDWELIADIALGPSAPGVLTSPAHETPDSHTSLPAAVGARPLHDEAHTVRNKQSAGGLFQPPAGSPDREPPPFARIDYSAVHIILSPEEEQQFHRFLTKAKQPSACHSSAFGAMAAEPVRKNPRWLCNVCERSNWASNVDCIGCRRARPANPRRPAEWVDNSLCNREVEVPPSCTDVIMWRTAHEALSFALSQTLRHDARAMGLQPLIRNNKDTTWYRIADLLAHPRFQAWGHSEEHIIREVEVNNKTRFVLHPDTVHISAWNGISLRDSDTRARLIGPAKLVHPDSVPPLLVHGTHNPDNEPGRVEAIARDGLKVRKRALHFMNPSDADHDSLWRDNITHIFDCHAQRAADEGIEFYECDNGVWLVPVDLSKDYFLGIRTIDEPLPKYRALEDYALDRGTTTKRVETAPNPPPPKVCTCVDRPPLIAGGTYCSQCKLLRPKHRRDAPEQPAAGSAGTELHTGRLSSWVADRNFGFITPEKGGRDIFFHGSNVLDDLRFLGRSKQVVYHLNFNPAKRSWEAIDIALPPQAGGRLSPAAAAAAEQRSTAIASAKRIDDLRTAADEAAQATLDAIESERIKRDEQLAAEHAALLEADTAPSGPELTAEYVEEQEHQAWLQRLIEFIHDPANRLRSPDQPAMLAPSNLTRTVADIKWDNPFLSEVNATIVADSSARLQPSVKSKRASSTCTDWLDWWGGGHGNPDSGTKAQTPKVAVSIYTPEPAVGWGVVGTDLLAALIAGVGLHNHVTLKYFPNDGIDNHWKDQPFDEHKVRDLAHALCTAMQLYPMGHYAVLCGNANAWGLGENYERRASILYEVFTERNVPFIGSGDAQSFFEGMTRREGWKGHDLFHFGSQEQNKKLAASYYLAHVTNTAHAPTAVHSLEALGPHSMVPRDAVLGTVPLSKQLDAQDETAGTGGSSGSDANVFPAETEAERMHRIASFRGNPAHFDVLNVLGSVELTDAGAVGVRFQALALPGEAETFWTVQSLTKSSPLRTLDIQPGSRLYLVNNHYAHAYDAEQLRAALSNRPVRMTFQLTRESVQARLSHIGSTSLPGSRYTSDLEYTLFEFHRFALCQGLAHVICFDNSHIISDEESRGDTHVPVGGKVLYGLKGMYQAIPDYDTTAGYPVGANDSLRRMHHGTPVAVVPAILESRGLRRHTRSLDNRYGCFVGNSEVAAGYAPPSLLCQGSSRKYQTIFAINCYRLESSPTQRGKYFIARENWIEIAGLALQYWGRGIPCMNQFYSQPPVSTPEAKTYLQSEVPRNWDLWAPLPAGPGASSSPPNTASFTPGVHYLAYVTNKPEEHPEEGCLLSVKVLPPDTAYTGADAWKPAYLAVAPDVYDDAQVSDLFEGVLYSKLFDQSAIFHIDNPEMNFRAPQPTAREVQALDKRDGSADLERRLELEEGYEGSISPEELANLKWSVQCVLEGRSTGFHIRTNTGLSYYHWKDWMDVQFFVDLILHGGEGCDRATKRCKARRRSARKQGTADAANTAHTLITSTADDTRKWNLPVFAWKRQLRNDPSRIQERTGLWSSRLRRLEGLPALPRIPGLPSTYLLQPPGPPAAKAAPLSAAVGASSSSSSGQPPPNQQAGGGGQRPISASGATPTLHRVDLEALVTAASGTQPKAKAKAGSSKGKKRPKTEGEKDKEGTGKGSGSQERAIKHRPCAPTAETISLPSLSYLFAGLAIVLGIFTVTNVFASRRTPTPAQFVSYPHWLTSELGLLPWQFEDDDGGLIPRCNLRAMTLAQTSPTSLLPPVDCFSPQGATAADGGGGNSRRVGKSTPRSRLRAHFADDLSCLTPGVTSITRTPLFAGMDPLRPTGLKTTTYEEERNQLVMDKIALSSQKTYANQYKWWKRFCRVRGVTPVWRTNEPNPEAENHVLDFIVHSGLVLNKAPGTVKLRISAIRNHHFNLGLPDPLLHMPRVRLALSGLKRRRGTQERRHPVTPRMLAYLKERLKPVQSHDGALVWAALCLGFFFLLRASEYLDVGRYTPGRGLQGIHVTLLKEGTPTERNESSGADEIRLVVAGSKTDIYNRGETRNHFANHEITYGQRLCVVEALAILYKHAPQSHRSGTDAHDQLLCDCQGVHLTRETLQAVLREAALATGTSPDSIGSHSLRFGGASALWSAYHDTGLVKRWGRWASDSFHTYVWEDRKGARGIATAMAGTDPVPV